MKKYQTAKLKEVIGNPDFKGERVLLEGVIRGLCYKPGNFFRSTKFEGLLEQESLVLGISGRDWFDQFSATKLLKTSSETGLPVKLKGKLKYSPNQYELNVSGVHYQGIDFRFRE